MLTIFSPEMKSKSEEPSYYTDGEAMFREKFSENLQMVEDIITSFGDDGNQLTKSKESTGFQKFLFSSLETLDIDVGLYRWAGDRVYQKIGTFSENG